jgi:uncharacterized protein
MPWPLRMTLYMSVIMFVIVIYHGLRFYFSVNRVHLRPVYFYNSIYIIGAILIFTYPVIGYIEYWTFGEFSYRTYPKFLIYAFWYGAVFFGVMFSWLILGELFVLFMAIGTSIDKPMRKVYHSYFIIAVTFFVVLYTGVKVYWHTHSIDIQRISFELNDDRADNLRPFTVVHIADLHADRFTDEDKIRRYIEKVNNSYPDIVTFAGDLITTGTAYIDTAAELMGEIRATYGVYAVIGDHDYWVDEDRVTDALENHGIKVLRNENHWINHGGNRIKLTGLTEIYSQQIPETRLMELLEEEDGESFRIVISHQATDRLVEASSVHQVDQLLAGHTHGGQIRIPVFFYPVTAAQAETDYVNGHWWVDDMLLKINNGLGFTLAPIRYNAPAQVSVITVW